MKLYFDNALGWQLPGQQSADAVRIDVPGTPAELAAWLNVRRFPAVPDETPATPLNPTHVFDWLCDQATPAQVEEGFVALGVRFHELRSAVRQQETVQ